MEAGQETLAADTILPAPMPPPPPPVLLVVATVVYDIDEVEAVAQEVSDALTTAAAALTNVEGEHPPMAQVRSSVTFPISLSTIPEGTPEREEFKNGFKSAMAVQIGGGGLFSPDSIIIDLIKATNRRRMQLRNERALQEASGVDVDWHVTIPAQVKQQVANL